MGMFEALEKLISEHGSAAVLSQRLELVKEQYNALEKKRDELLGKVASLEATIQILRGEKAVLEKRNATLQSKLESLTAPNDPLSPECWRVLEELFKNTLSLWSLSTRLAIPEGLLKYNVDKLLERQLVQFSGREWGSNSEVYELTATGRKYFVETEPPG